MGEGVTAIVGAVCVDGGLSRLVTSKAGESSLNGLKSKPIAGILNRALFEFPGFKNSPGFNAIPLSEVLIITKNNKDDSRKG